MDSYHLHIRCPRCEKRASFEQPFAFLHAEPVGETRPTHRWGGWYVVEKYPNVLSWAAPKSANQVLHQWPGWWHSFGTLPVRGVVKCEECHLIAAHDLAWPEDAYYRWDVKGRTLWAWSAEHAIALRDFIGSDARNPALHGEFERSLHHLPTEFLSAKVRDETVKKITRSFST